MQQKCRPFVVFSPKVLTVQRLLNGYHEKLKGMKRSIFGKSKVIHLGSALFTPIVNSGRYFFTRESLFCTSNLTSLSDRESVGRLSMSLSTTAPEKSRSIPAVHLLLFSCFEQQRHLPNFVFERGGPQSKRYDVNRLIIAPGIKFRDELDH